MEKQVNVVGKIIIVRQLCKKPNCDNLKRHFHRDSFYVISQHKDNRLKVIRADVVMKEKFVDGYRITTFTLERVPGEQYKYLNGKNYSLYPSSSIIVEKIEEI